MLLVLIVDASFRRLCYRNVKYKEKIFINPLGTNNTVLAFMICFLINLNYNVLIMCEWHQLVYFAIITANKPTTPPDFRCISPFVWQQPKMPISWSKNNTKNYTYLSPIFNPKYLFKNEKSTFTVSLKVRPLYLTRSCHLTVFRGLYFSHFIRPSLAYLKLPRSRPKRIQGNSAIARGWNSSSFYFTVFFLLL